MPIGAFKLNSIAKYLEPSAPPVVLRTARTISVFGNTKVLTTQSKFGGASAYFDGTGDYLQIADNDDFDFNQTSVTLEMWFRPSSVTVTDILMGKRDGSNSGWQLNITTGSAVSFNVYQSGSTIIGISGGTLTANTWHHVAVTKSGDVFKLYLNGSQVGTDTLDTGGGEAIVTNTVNIGIGRYLGFTTFDYTGFIDEIRFSHSVRYTTTFTPSSTAFINDSDTKLLIHCDGISNSTIFTDDTGINISSVGGAQISTAQSKFGGASFVGNGTGSWLDVYPKTEFSTGTNNFTYECWFRLNDITVMTALFDTRPIDGTNGAYPTVFVYTSKITYYYNDDFRITGSTTLSSNTWYHMALVRNGSTHTIYINGTSQGSYTNSASVTGINSFRIGGGAGSNYILSGYIDEFRVSNNARYTSNFTAPTAEFTYDSNTLLLAHCDGDNASTTFVDTTS